MEDPRTKKGDESYPAPGGVGNDAPAAAPAVNPGPSAPTVAPGARSVPAAAPAAPVVVPAAAPLPEHPDTNRRHEESPAGSTTSPVPQQVPKQK